MNVTLNSSPSVAICAIMKDERQDDILEWMHHHLAVGVSHFYLYDNGSASALASLFDGVGCVTVRNAPGLRRQMDVYNACCHAPADGGFKEDWCAFIDADEFLMLPKPLGLRILNKFAGDVSSVCLNWRVYGSSGLETSVPGTRLTSFTHYTRDNGFNHHVKSIVRQGRRHRWDNPHFCKSQPGYQVHVTGVPVAGPFFEANTTPYWRADVDRERCGYIAHYYTGSRADWERKMARGRADTGTSRTWEEFNACNAGCTFTDRGFGEFDDCVRFPLKDRVEASTPPEFLP